MTYVPIKFPGWRWGIVDGKLVSDVFDRAEDVPAGWTDNPNDFDAPEQPTGDNNPDKASREEVIQALKAKGIKFDGRWSDARLEGLLK